MIFPVRRCKSAIQPELNFFFWFDKLNTIANSNIMNLLKHALIPYSSAHKGMR